ncbi:MAG: EutN/CcmL family microcompartment protein, partial [bacterium]|nr:EutN/CcmL family microcompartment protein [bacterium]
MNLGKVIGTVVCTRKDERLEGLKLLVVRFLDIRGNPTDSYVVAVDTVQAGFGETVVTVSGSSGRQTELTE